MRTLENNDWILLNSIIYKIHTTNDLAEMRRVFLDQCRLLLDFDSADFYLASKEQENALCSPVTYRCEENLASYYEQMTSNLGIELYSGKSLIYRPADFVPESQALANHLHNVIYKPNNWNYSLQMILAYDHRFAGVVTFYRSIGKDNFDYDDIFLLDLFKEHLAYRCYHGHTAGALSPEKLTIPEAAAKYSLTRQEVHVLERLMAGENNAQICDELVISVNTLKKHILNIYRKLNIRNRVQLFKMILENPKRE